MRFLGTIVITDPCYIKHTLKYQPPMKRGTIYGDWSCMVYPGNMQENKKYEEWSEKYKAFWKDYNFGGHTDEEKKQILDEFNKYEKEWKENEVIGEFCADSGQVAVFEWDRLSEEDKRWTLDHPWCAAIIKDFFGDVEFNVEDGKYLHLIGISENHVNDFFTVQSGF